MAERNPVRTPLPPRRRKPKLLAVVFQEAVASEIPSKTSLYPRHIMEA